MVKKIKKPKGKVLTMQERSDKEDQAIRDGADVMEIIRDGKRYRPDAEGNLIPVNGTQAQEAIKKTRKPRKPKAPKAGG